MLLLTRSVPLEGLGSHLYQAAAAAAAAAAVVPCICGRVARGGRSLLSTQPPVMVLRKNAYQYVNVVLGFVGMGQKFGLKVSQNDLKYACLHPK